MLWLIGGTRTRTSMCDMLVVSIQGRQGRRGVPSGEEGLRPRKHVPRAPQATASTDDVGREQGRRRAAEYSEREVRSTRPARLHCSVRRSAVRRWPRTLASLNAELLATPYRCFPPTSELSRQKRSRTLTTDASVEEADGRVSDCQVRKAYSHADARGEQLPLGRSMQKVPSRSQSASPLAVSLVKTAVRCEVASTLLKHAAAALPLAALPKDLLGYFGEPHFAMVQQTTMRTPTLVVAIILAMAMAGDSANIERLLRQLRLLAGEETIDEASMTHTKGKTVDTEETQLLDLVKKLSLESKEPEPIDVYGERDTDVDLNHKMAKTQDQDPTLKEVVGEKVSDVEQNYDMAGLGDQNPTSEEEEAEGGEVTEQNYDQSETGEESSTSTEDGSEQAADFGQNYGMTGFQNQDPTSEEVGGEQAPDVGQNYGMTGPGDQDPTSKGNDYAFS
ncbi:hypothetical protein Bbelb_361830 [Branchiostoma belcheri]|nr:hypothetical protein Bbelb_361830 [Branchiostoma belcheri]